MKKLVFIFPMIAFFSFACNSGDSQNPTSSNAPTSQNLAQAVNEAPLPANYDLRFKGITIGSAGTYLKSTLLSGFNGTLSASYTNQLGAPLVIGGAGSCKIASFVDCDWFYDVWGGVSGVDSSYQSGSLENMTSDLVSLSGNVVITGLDVQSSSKAYGVSFFNSHQSALYWNTVGSATKSAFSADVSQAATEGKIVTALSIDDSGMVYAVYSSWAGDTSTRFETQVAQTNYDADSIERAARGLAADGYVISALGGNDSEGLTLVGTRVEGASAARPISIPTSDFSNRSLQSAISNTALAPSIPVGVVITPDLKNSGSFIWTWIYEN